MARRRNRKGFEILASLPWPAGIVAGLVCFFGIRYLPVWWFSSQGGTLTHELGANFAPARGAVVPWWIGQTGGQAMPSRAAVSSRAAGER